MRHRNTWIRIQHVGFRVNPLMFHTGRHNYACNRLDARKEVLPWRRRLTNREGSSRAPWRGQIPSNLEYNQKGGFGLTPGQLLTLSKLNPYLKYVLTPAQKLRKITNLWKSSGRFDGEAMIATSDIPHRTSYLRLQLGLYTILQSLILYGVWHTPGVRCGGRILSNGRAMVLQ